MQAIADFSESLKVYQPLMQLSSLGVQILILWRVWIAMRQLRLEEAKARKEGIDADHAESTGHP